jgi:hypothetical protein
LLAVSPPQESLIVQKVLTVDDALIWVIEGPGGSRLVERHFQASLDGSLNGLRLLLLPLWPEHFASLDIFV